MKKMRDSEVEEMLSEVSEVIADYTGITMSYMSTQKLRGYIWDCIDYKVEVVD